MLANCPEWSNVKSWVNEDGKWIPGFASKGFMDGLVQLRTLWTSGVLDRDFAIGKNGDGANKFLSGKAFVLCQSTLSDLNKFIQLNPGVNASDALGIMKIWPAADGKRYSFVETPYWSETFFNFNLNDEKFDRALQLVDYMSTEEYIAQLVNGIEGIDYKVENGKSISLLPRDQQLNTKYPITSAIGILGAWPGEFANYSGKKVVNSNPAIAWGDQYIIDTYNEFKASLTPAPINFDIMLMHTPAKDKISALQNQILTVDIPNVILGKDDPQKMWQDILKGYDAKGLQDAITEVNAEAAKLGIK
jgi:putative aldouronate transport system substrate-binding protein